MTPAKVTFVLPSLAPGGAERVFATLLAHLDRSRFAPTLVVLGAQATGPSVPVPPDVPVIHLSRPRARQAAPALARLIREQQPAVVFGAIAHVNLLLALLRPVLPRATRLVGRETNMVSAALASGFMPRGTAFAYRWLLPQLDRLVCQSTGMRNDLVGVLGFPADRTVVIPNPLDVAAIQAQVASEPPPRDTATLRLVAAGRLDPIKGFDLLLDAMALCPDLPLTLEVLGEGPARETLEALCLTRGLTDRVAFPGYTPAPWPSIAAADAFVSCSRVDAFPNVVLEALACGTPVIALPAPGGIREILADRPECKLAEAVSAEALAEALRRWVARGPRRVPPEAVARYEVGAVVRQYETMLQAVIDG